MIFGLVISASFVLGRDRVLWTRQRVHIRARQIDVLTWCWWWMKSLRIAEGMDNLDQGRYEFMYQIVRQNIQQLSRNSHKTMNVNLVVVLEEKSRDHQSHLDSSSWNPCSHDTSTEYGYRIIMQIGKIRLKNNYSVGMSLYTTSFIGSGSCWKQFDSTEAFLSLSTSCNCHLYEPYNFP